MVTASAATLLQKQLSSNTEVQPFNYEYWTQIIS